MSNYRVDRRLEVPCPPIEPGYNVSAAQWKVIMERVKVCGDQTNWTEALGWACIGFAGSALVAAVSLPLGVKFVEVGPAGESLNLWAVAVQFFFVMATGLGFGCGALSLAHARTVRQMQKRLQDLVLEDMQHVADRHSPGTRTIPVNEGGVSP